MKKKEGREKERIRMETCKMVRNGRRETEEKTHLFPRLRRSDIFFPSRCHISRRGKSHTEVAQKNTGSHKMSYEFQYSLSVREREREIERERDMEMEMERRRGRE